MSAQPARKPIQISQHEIDVCISESLLDCFGLVKQGLIDRYNWNGANMSEQEARALAANLMASWPHFEKD